MADDGDVGSAPRGSLVQRGEVAEVEDVRRRASGEDELARPRLDMQFVAVVVERCEDDVVGARAVLVGAIIGAVPGPPENRTGSRVASAAVKSTARRSDPAKKFSASA